MKQIIPHLISVQPYITIALIVVIFILLIIMLALVKAINRLEKKYRRLTRGINNKNLEEIITSYLDNIDEVKEESNEVKKQQEELAERLNKCVQRVGIVRYKAFDDVGSDLSFSIALLDDNNDGIVITGIYGRNDSTVYAKPIDKGISRYDLSQEEQEVLMQVSNE
ncbi:DUF4446 family protein [Clostridium botulinum]|uniref:DUF4446 domain-containing protein n=1 Tax=Clostridium botulinum C/D str. DC5 TaxID=1443128 RepID=A0A0A0IAX5_CLOBO|nr:DUF4446 family protein [Clostridium botulinum]KEI01988.1 hypothetical protein Z952_10240 [Clostridium botulinum C/D str. BKT75002]KEI10090.1 hypothetical protein Z954_10975 [Clostridium botulinum C/D str. BKT2873]KGM98155.1 hypothetical protein Z956_00295 [Clostridium botulinum D str. CCUG 7971]KGM98609.1 hypothetical protein Z955_10875 [Clostridium botulinum C/D str. DC5]KOC50365.1 hypothetical protein ADU88_02575 [Clostridium botulinum]